MLDGSNQEEIVYPQQQAYDYPQYVQPQMSQQNPDVIKYRLESDDLLDSLEHDLKGEAFINKKWTPMYGKWLNEEGISIIISLVSRYVNRGSYLGNLSNDQIAFKCKTLSNALNKHLFLYYRLYDIESRTKARLLVRKVVDMIHLSLSRSEQAFESQQIGQTTNVQNIVHEDRTQQQAPGIFNAFNRFKR